MARAAHHCTSREHRQVRLAAVRAEQRRERLALDADHAALHVELQRCAEIGLRITHGELERRFPVSRQERADVDQALHGFRTPLGGQRDDDTAEAMPKERYGRTRIHHGEHAIDICGQRHLRGKSFVVGVCRQRHAADAGALRLQACFDFFSDPRAIPGTMHQNERFSVELCRRHIRLRFVVATTSQKQSSAEGRCLCGAREELEDLAG